MRITIATACCLLCLCFSLSAGAQTHYISDILVVNVRDSSSDNHQVLERLTSNTPVTILGDRGAFFQVRTPSGVEGYILKQYITAETPKALLSSRLQTELDTLKQNYAALQRQLSSADAGGAGQPHLAELAAQLETTRFDLQRITEDYETLRENASDVLQLTEEKLFLEEQNQLLNMELAVLREENRSFHRSNMIQWFLAGAGVFFGGWLIGKISRHKQRGFSRY